MTDPFGEDADCIPRRKRTVDGGKCFVVFRNVYALIEPAVDGDRTGSRDHGAQGTVKQSGLGEKPYITVSRRPDDRGIEERVRVIRKKDGGAGGWRGADKVHSVEQPAGQARNHANGRGDSAHRVLARSSLLASRDAGCGMRDAEIRDWFTETIKQEEGEGENPTNRKTN
jgi:hypothetical protein